MLIGQLNQLAKHIIDCDANPFPIKGWEVMEHRKGGQFEWNPEKISLYRSELQKNDNKDIDGAKLREELNGMSVMNANVLDYLLAHTELIPEEWDDKDVLFWGTIYHHHGGGLFVRCLIRANGEPMWSSKRIDTRFFASFFSYSAVLLA